MLSIPRRDRFIEVFGRKVSDERLLLSYSIVRRELCNVHYTFPVAELPNTPPSRPKNNNIRRKICKSIFDNPSFRLYAENWINVDPKDIRAELRENHPLIFNRIFTKRETLLDDNYYEYENRYRMVRIRFEGHVHVEYTFICLLRHQQSHEIKEYYVTQEYNVNLVVGARPIAGRFLILNDHTDDRVGIILEAVAEEPAQFTLGALSSEAGYARVRNKYSPSKCMQHDCLASYQLDNFVPKGSLSMIS
jgi:hypothetical protein